MTDKTKTFAAQVRAVFEQAGPEGCSYQTLYRTLAADGEGKAAARDRIMDVVRYLVAAGYLAKDGHGSGAVFRRTGQAMHRPRLTDAQRADRKRQRNRRKSEKKRQGRAATVGVRASMIPKPVRQPPKAEPPAETVEQFLLRNGHIQRLPASWDLTA